MPRITRDSRLETRQKRTTLLARHEPYWRLIDKGFYLGYRKGKPDSSGTWIARLLIEGKYKKKSIGNADDYRDDNRADTYGYKTAQAKAREWADNKIRSHKGITNKDEYTVEDAVKDYLKDYATRGKAYDTTKITFDAHIIPKLGNNKLVDLTTKAIRGWHHSLANSPARMRSGKGVKKNTRQTENPRPRKATANRILTALKAALNLAWRDGFIDSNEAWTKVKPFQKVDMPKVRYLNKAECKRLVNACSTDFRLLVQGALYTGCRYGELTKLKCNDFDARSKTLSIGDTKSGMPRHVPLTDTGSDFFKRLKTGRKGSDWMFKRANGDTWGRSHQIRPIKEASKIAKIDPPASFHILRHTYGSALAMNGVPIQVIAIALGHADTRITSRHYAHLMPSYVADTIRANLPDFGGYQADNVISLNS